ncbi:MAG: site-specific integrase [Acidiferrobacteraceae bacterium]
MPALVPLTPPTPPALAATVEQARSYAEAATAPATRKAYAADRRDFAAFAATQDASSLPAAPALVALYATTLAGTKTVATIRRRMVAIAQAHKNAQQENPVAHPQVQAILQGIARTKGVAQRKKDALTVDRLRDALLTLTGDSLKARRDRALLLLAFACAARRSEVAALDVADLRFDRRGLIVTLRRSKTDQTGQGREIGVPYVAHEGLCAVRAVRAWLDAAAITEGPVFRTFSLAGDLTPNRIDPKDVARLVKRVVAKAGITGDFAAHSLRAGFITTAAATKGVSEADIQRVSGHRSVAILRGYVRRATVFEGAPLAAIFA